MPGSANPSPHPAGGAEADGYRHMPERITSLDELARRLPGLVVTDDMRRTARRYPFAVTPYYLSLIEVPDPSDPIFRQCVPDPGELIENPELSADELGEFTRYSPVPGLIHRYPDRVVCMTTVFCPTYCRHCTRKRLVGKPAGEPTSAVLDAHVDYVRSHPGIKDVILSGGDPLTLPDERLEHLLARFRDIPSVDILRVGTRAPVTLPSRIDDALCATLEKYHPVWLNTQFNHPRELTPQAATACDRLLRHGVPVSNQTVLLRGVNDAPETMEALCRGLLRVRVRPYYLFQCDPVAGVEHFRTPVARGVRILEHLQRALGGLGVPRLAADAVRAGGKVPIGPSYVLGHKNGRLVMRNADGETVTYPDGPSDCSAGPAAPSRDPRPAAPRRNPPSPPG